MCFRFVILCGKYATDSVAIYSPRMEIGLSSLSIVSCAILRKRRSVVAEYGRYYCEQVRTKYFLVYIICANTMTV